MANSTELRCKCCINNDYSEKGLFEQNQKACLIDNYTRWRLKRRLPLCEKEIDGFQKSRTIGDVLANIMSFKWYPIDTNETFTVRMNEEYLHGLWIKTFKKRHPIDFRIHESTMSNFTSSTVFYREF